jgi:hypothetical protein
MPLNPEKVRQIMIDSIEHEDIKRGLKTLYRDYKIGDNYSIILTLYKSQVEITSVDISPSCCSDVAVDDSIPVIDQEWAKFPQRLIAEYLENINENNHEFLDALGIDGSADDIELKLQFVPLETTPLPNLMALEADGGGDGNMSFALGVDSIENNLTPSSSKPFSMMVSAGCNPRIRCGRPCCF